MKRPFLISAGAFRRVAFSAALLAAIPLAAQAPLAKPAAKTTSASKKWTLQHTPNGQPDFQGIWSFATLTPLERPKELGNKASFTEAEAIEFANRTQQQVSTDRR